MVSTLNSQEELEGMVFSVGKMPLAKKPLTSHAVSTPAACASGIGELSRLKHCRLAKPHSRPSTVPSHPRISIEVEGHGVFRCGILAVWCGDKLYICTRHLAAKHFRCK